MKHIWINKRTAKGVKPVREWIECNTCGAVHTDDNGTVSDVCKGKPS